jgi:DNA-binding transcriptional LysR family regulator
LLIRQTMEDLIHTTAMRYFLEVARCGSISAASAALHVAGSAISRQIAMLEERMGVQLFERRPRGMVPSEAGLVLLRYARHSTLEAERIANELRSTGSARTTIRVASSDSLATDFLPEVFADFRRDHPGSRFHLQVMPPIEATRYVRDGEADIAVTFSIAPEKGVRIDHAERYPIFAMIKKNHPLAKQTSVSLADMHPYPLALAGEGATVRQLFDICCSLEGLAFEPVFISNLTGALLRYTQVSGALTLVGHLTLGKHMAAAGLIAVPVSNPGMNQRTIQVQTMAARTLPAPVRTFLEFLISSIRKSARPPGRSGRKKSPGPA